MLESIHVVAEKGKATSFVKDKIRNLLAPFAELKITTAPAGFQCLDHNNVLWC